MMETHAFTLVLSGVDEHTQGLEDTLFEAGCDDALVNVRNSAVYLDFDRDAESLEDAVISAIVAVETAGLGAVVASVAPDDLVSESDIAKRLALKRQAVSLWVKGARRAHHPFPKPIRRLTERSPLWRWVDVLTWCYEQGRLITDKKIIQHAQFIEDMNGVLSGRERQTRQYRRTLLNKLEARQAHH